MHLRALPLTIVGLAAVVLLASGCQKYKDQIASQKDEIEKLRLSLAGLTDEKGDLEGSLAGLQADKKALEEKVGELEARITSLMGYVAELEGNLEKLGGDKAAMSQKRLDTLKGLLGKFKSLIAGGKLNVRIRDGKLMLELPSAVLFESGKYEVSENGMTTLGEVAKVLSQIKDREFQVAGHTDDVPVTTKALEDNWNLSALRAVAVVRALQEMGVNPKNLSASGYSEYSPMVKNDSKDHQAQNRRIEIILMPNLNELPDLTELEKEIK
jgi:chemotaxis protein MotB